jgi:alpha-tubulin suppressor-like RCC1 family protein
MALTQYWSGGKGILSAGQYKTWFHDTRGEQTFSWGDNKPPDTVLDRPRFSSAHFGEGLFVLKFGGDVVTVGEQNDLRRFVPPCDPHQEKIPRRLMYRPLCFEGEPIRGGARGGACGFNFGLVVVDEEGRVMGYGNNRFGQLGPNNMGSDDVETQYIIPELKDVATVMKDGTVRTCGRNQFGQLGYETLEGSSDDKEPLSNPIPVEVGGLENIVCIACGYYNTLALRNDGQVFSWGHNLLGLGSEVRQRTEPMALNGIENAIDIACGRHHAVILRADGTIRSFAAARPHCSVDIFRLLGEFRGQSDLTIPELVPGIRNGVGVACGDEHTTVMIKDDAGRGILFFIFGQNSHQQFGAEKPPEIDRGVIKFVGGRMLPM